MLQLKIEVYLFYFNGHNKTKMENRRKTTLTLINDIYEGQKSEDQVNGVYITGKNMNQIQYILILFQLRVVLLSNSSLFFHSNQKLLFDNLLLD
jgi:hypothetical protein